MSDPAHVPVLLAEVVEALKPRPGALIVDGTFGAGGYSRAFLHGGASVIAFDRDPSANAFAADLESSGRFTLIEDRFSRMADRLGPASADGVALDLGVSSMQLNEPERGFSLMRDGPLDMRMGTGGETAAELLADATPADLVRIFRIYGEEPHARRIAGAIVRARAEKPFTRTLELAEFIEALLGGRRGARTHPATRVFQALRIAVNAELDELAAGLAGSERVLRAGGRLAVVTFHSLEDRLVKTFLAERAGRTPGASRHAPPAASGAPPSFRLLSARARTAGAAEVAANPRARSAKLRAAERTDAPVWRAAA